MLHRHSCPFICTVDQQTNPSLLSKTFILPYQKKKKGQTNINKCIRTRLNVQCRRCPNHKMFSEGTKATWSCVFTMLCIGGDAVVKGELSVKNALEKKKRKTVCSFWWISFLFSNLYINCNVRSCQYSTFVS